MVIPKTAPSAFNQALLEFGIALGRIATLGDIAAAAGMVAVRALLLAVASG